MNTPNDIRWLLFATVPVHGYINLATPVARGIVWLLRRLRIAIVTCFAKRAHPRAVDAMILE